MLRPGRAEMSTLVPDVDGSVMLGNLMLGMWFAEPSSSGTGKLDGREGPLEACR